MIWKLHCDRNKEEFDGVAREMKVVENKYAKMSELNEWLGRKVLKEGKEL